MRLGSSSCIVVKNLEARATGPARSTMKIHGGHHFGLCLGESRPGNKVPATNCAFQPSVGTLHHHDEAQSMFQCLLALLDDDQSSHWASTHIDTTSKHWTNNTADEAEVYYCDLTAHDDLTTNMT